MPRGGYRPGAGRPPGALTVKSREVQAAVLVNVQVHRPADTAMVNRYGADGSATLDKAQDVRVRALADTM